MIHLSGYAQLSDKLLEALIYTEYRKPLREVNMALIWHLEALLADRCETTA